MPLQSFWPAQDAFVSVLQPLLPLQLFLPLQQFLSPGTLTSVEGTFGAAWVSAPPQPAEAPDRAASIPVIAVVASALPSFIPTTLAQNRPVEVWRHVVNARVSWEKGPWPNPMSCPLSWPWVSA